VTLHRFEQSPDLRFGVGSAFALVNAERAAHRPDRLPDGQADPVETGHIGKTGHSGDFGSDPGEGQQSIGWNRPRRIGRTQRYHG
jgi:hypothetical protein